MEQHNSSTRAVAWGLVVGAAALLAITQGTRSSLGLFVSPINTATGFGFAAISLAIAVNQLAAGLAQPLLGAVADRHGTMRMIVAGSLCSALALLGAIVADTPALFGVALAAHGVAGVAVGSSSTLLAVVAQRLPPERRGLASGIVGAGGSAGQLLIGPATQVVVAGAGWTAGLVGLALVALAAVPIARLFRSAPASPLEPHAPAQARGVDLRTALGIPAYWLVTATFFVCGFHVSFLLTHMPGVIESCGLPASLSGTWLAIIGLCNIGGSIATGQIIQRVPMKRVLATLYALRAAGVLAFAAAPKTELTVLLFALWMGVSYMATLPPTSGLLAKLFGTRHMGKLFGLTMLAHQVGCFLGAWLGGLMLERTGDYHMAWGVDIVLALAATVCSLAIRETAIERLPVPAAARAAARRPANDRLAAAEAGGR